MSDLRTFEPLNDVSAESSFRLSKNDVISEPIHTRDDDDKGGLGEFHTNEAELDEEVGGGSRSKVISALVVALMVCAVGGYAYHSWTPTPKDMVPDRDLPVTAANAPGPATPTPTQNTITPTVPAPQKLQLSNYAKAPSKSVRAPGQPMLTEQKSASVSIPAAPVVTPENQAVAEPISPTPPASAVAGNPSANEQSAPASDVPVTQTTPQSTGPAPFQPNNQEPTPAQPDSQGTPAVPVQ